MIIDDELFEKMSSRLEFLEEQNGLLMQQLENLTPDPAEESDDIPVLEEPPVEPEPQQNYAELILRRHMMPPHELERLERIEKQNHRQMVRQNMRAAGEQSRADLEAYKKMRAENPEKFLKQKYEQDEARRKK